MKPNPPGRLRHRAMAYTLVEVLVASGVVGFMVISLYAGFASGFALVRLAREDQRATQIMARKLEAVRLCTWSQLTNLPVSFQETFDPFASTNDPHALVYSGQLVTSLPDRVPDSASYKHDLRLVTVTVSWTNYDGGRQFVRQRQMQTQIARYGMQNYAWGFGP